LERQAAQEAQRFLSAIVECPTTRIVAYTPSAIILTWNGGAELSCSDDACRDATEAEGGHLRPASSATPFQSMSLKFVASENSKLRLLA
jgi:hypothetical protein